MYDQGIAAAGWAAHGGHTEALKLLIRAGVLDNTPSSARSRANLLTNAAKGGHVDTMEYLLETDTQVYCSFSCCVKNHSP